MEKPDQFQKPSLIGTSGASPGGFGRRAFLGLSVASIAPIPAFAAPNDPPALADLSRPTGYGSSRACSIAI